MLISKVGNHFISSISCHHHLVFPLFAYLFLSRFCSLSLSLSLFFFFLSFFFSWVEFDEQSRTSSDEVITMVFTPNKVALLEPCSIILYHYYERQ